MKLSTLIIRCVFVALLFLPASGQAIHRDAPVSDEFLAGYIAAMLERDLKWPRWSYELEVRDGAVRIALPGATEADIAAARERVLRIEGVQLVAIESKPLGEGRERILFPLSSLVPTLVADPKEPRFFVSAVHLRAPDARTTAALVGFGTDFGLVRWVGEEEGEGWQLSLFGVAFSQFDLEAPSQDLINTDFLAGFPLTYKRGPFGLRLRLFHQSSHLGDELILGGAAPPRINLSVEAVDAIATYSDRGYRLYAGGGYLVNRDPSSLHPRWLHAGFDYRATHGGIAGRHFIGGVDVKWFEEVQWEPGVSVMAGLALGKPAPWRRGVDLMVNAYEGPAPFGQFFSQDIEYYGLGLFFDF